jgi:dTMP kinase
MAAGRFIVFEGLDGSGTTTQLVALEAWLVARAHNVLVTHEPSDGAVGRVLRRAIDGGAIDDQARLDPVTLALAFAADRADHLAAPGTGVNAALDRGLWVLSDRYVFSSLAYQSGQGLPLEWLAGINRFARPPDLTIFIDTPPEECLRRIEARGVPGLFHDLAHLQRTLAGYRSAFSGWPALAGRLLEIDGSGSPAAVTRAVIEGISGWLGQ